MAMNILPAGRYAFEDVEPGDTIETGSLTVEVDHIERFANLTGDRFEIHMSDEGATKHGFPARVAHGLLILSLIDGLKNQAHAQFAAIASLGWNWKFAGPVFPGDTIRSVMTVAAKRETKRADRGIITIDCAVLNQHERVVQSGTNILMISRRV